MDKWNRRFSLYFRIHESEISPINRLKIIPNNTNAVSVTFFYANLDQYLNETVHNKYSNEGKSEVYIIKDSDHHMYIDNPEELA